MQIRNWYSNTLTFYVYQRSLLLVIYIRCISNFPAQNLLRQLKCNSGAEFAIYTIIMLHVGASIIVKLSTIRPG